MSGVVGISRVRDAVADHFKLRRDELTGPKRHRPLVYHRQLAMYLCRLLTDASLPEIGRRFGGRDHTTVLYAVRMMAAKLKQDDDLARHAEEICLTLSHWSHCADLSPISKLRKEIGIMPLSTDLLERGLVLGTQDATCQDARAQPKTMRVIMTPTQRALWESKWATSASHG